MREIPYFIGPGGPPLEGNPHGEPGCFVREAWQELDAVLPLAEIGVSLPLAEIYANVEFPADP